MPDKLAISYVQSPCSMWTNDLRYRIMVWKSMLAIQASTDEEQNPDIKQAKFVVKRMLTFSYCMKPFESYSFPKRGKNE